MRRNIWTYVFAASFITMVVSSYFLILNIQSSMQDETIMSHERMLRLKQAIRVNEYVLKLNNPDMVQDDDQAKLNVFNEFSSEENKNINSSFHRKLREEVVKQLNQNKVPETHLVNRWLSSSMVNDMIEQEKDFEPSQVNVAPLVVMTNMKWASILSVLWLSTLFAAYSASVIINGIIPLNKTNSKVIKY